MRFDPLSLQFPFSTRLHFLDHETFPSKFIPRAKGGREGNRTVAHDEEANDATKSTLLKEKGYVLEMIMNDISWCLCLTDVKTTNMHGRNEGRDIYATNGDHLVHLFLYLTVWPTLSSLYVLCMLCFEEFDGD